MEIIISVLISAFVAAVIVTRGQETPRARHSREMREALNALRSGRQVERNQSEFTYRQFERIMP